MSQFTLEPNDDPHMIIVCQGPPFCNVTSGTPDGDAIMDKCTMCKRIMSNEIEPEDTVQ